MVPGEGRQTLGPTIKAATTVGNCSSLLQGGSRKWYKTSLRIILASEGGTYPPLPTSHYVLNGHFQPSACEGKVDWLWQLLLEALHLV